MQRTLWRRLFILGLLTVIGGLSSVGYAQTIDDDATPLQGDKRTTTLVSLDVNNEAFGIDSVLPSLSANGRYVVFSTRPLFQPASTMNEEIPLDRQVYIRDRRTNTTELISVNLEGQPGNGISSQGRTDASGRFVVFESEASDLVPNDTNELEDIFVRDTLRGTTERVSVSSSGEQVVSGRFNANPSISGNGRYVAFVSDADNLTPDGGNGFNQVYVRDLVRGVTERATVATDGSLGNFFTGSSSLSADGRYVAYISFANNLVPDDTNEGTDAFVYDRRTQQTVRVNVATDGSQATPPAGEPTFPLIADVQISPDGRYAVFSSRADNLVPGDTNGRMDVFVRDMVRETTERISVATDGAEGDDASSDGAITPGGRYVVFRSSATNLVANDTNGVVDVFVRDRVRGTTKRVSIAADGAESNGANGLVDRLGARFVVQFDAPSIDWAGRTVAFDSQATNLVLNDMNGQNDIFVRTR